MAALSKSVMRTVPVMAFSRVIGAGREIRSGNVWA